MRRSRGVTFDVAATSCVNVEGLQYQMPPALPPVPEAQSSLPSSENALRTTPVVNALVSTADVLTVPAALTNAATAFPVVVELAVPIACPSIVSHRPSADVARLPSVVSVPTSVSGWLFPLAVVGSSTGDPMSPPSSPYVSMKTGAVVFASAENPSPTRTTSNAGTTHDPPPLQICPPLSVHAVPTVAIVLTQVLELHAGAAQSVGEAGQSAAVLHCTSQSIVADAEV